MPKPAIITTNKLLPFGELSPLEFERLCLWLVEREGYARPQHLGEAGGEQGRDIVAYKISETDQETWYFQCKRYNRIDAPSLKKEVDKYNELNKSDLDKRPTGLVFVTNSAVSAKIRDKVGDYCRKHGYKYEFWARTELDMRVKRHPDIVSEFFSAAAAPAILALHQLPPPPRDFTGRKDELDQLKAKIEQGGVTISGLQGMGGIGKTALALKLAEQLAGRYPDAQFYLDLKGTSVQHLSVTDILAHVIRAYQPNVKLPENEVELSGLYQTVLNGQRALLLMDNAADREQVEPLIPPQSCALIVTSRQRFAMPGLFSSHLNALTHQDACAFLLTIAPRIGDHAETIAKLCGYLPLALRLAASVLAEYVDLTVIDYARQLTNVHRRLELIEASLSLSYELLDPEMQKLWCALAVFPETFDVSAAAAVWNVRTDATQDALGELVKYSLVEWNESTARYRLHDLVRLFADSHLSKTTRAMSQKQHAEHYLSVLENVTNLYDQGGEALQQGLLLFDLEWGNIQRGQAYTELYANDNNGATQLSSAYCDAGVSLLNLRQHPRERIEWLELALRAAQRLHLRDAEGRHLCNLGRVYRTVGQRRCDPTYFERALAIAREVGNRYDEGQALGNLGVLYRECNQDERAVAVLEERLAIARELADPKGEGNALGNLGVAYMQLREYTKALDLFEQQLVIAREIGDRRMEGQAFGNVGVAHRKSGDIHRAIEYHEQSLSIHKEIKNSRGEGGAWGDLGRDHMVLDEPQHAIECYEQSLAIQRKVGYLSAEGHALWNLSLAYNRLGDQNRTMTYAKAALDIFEKVGDSNATYVRKKIDKWSEQ